MRAHLFPLPSSAILVWVGGDGLGSIKCKFMFVAVLFLRFLGYVIVFIVFEILVW